MKTKLGISVGLVGATVYFVGMIGSTFTVLGLLIYILTFENNEWLRRSALKAAILFASFYLVSVCVNFLPDIISIFDSMLGIFGGDLTIMFMTRIASVINQSMNLLEKVLFIILGFKAINQKSLNLGPIENFIDRHYQLETSQQ